jgi:hypothetical protein
MKKKYIQERDDYLVVVKKETLKNKQQVNYSTWEGLGRLFPWAITQVWWEDFLDHCHFTMIEFYWTKLIEPHIFAEKIYEFLKIRDEEKNKISFSKQEDK